MRVGNLYCICFAVFLVWMGTSSCEKEAPDPRDKWVGRYQVKGTSRFVYNAFGQYSDYTREDSASFTIGKPGSSDSTAYLHFKGVIFDPQGGNYSLKFAP